MSTHPQAPHDGEAAAPAKPTPAQAAAASAAADAAAASTVLVLPHSEKVALALVRMQASRARLRSALVPAPEPDDSAGGRRRGARGAGVKLGDVGRLLWRQLRGPWRRSPSLQVAVHTLQTWWRKQPWHSAVSLVGGELQGIVEPLVRRNPWSAVAGAAAVGATVMLVRPWRWSLVSGQWRKLRSELLGAVRTQVFHVPLQMLLASLASLLVVQAQGGASADDTGDAGSDGAGAGAAGADGVGADTTGAAPPGGMPGAGSS